MRVLLLSAYAARSHEAWRLSLEQGLPDWRWTVLSLPPRHFSWRVRGNPLSWAFSEQEALAAEYDLLLATSMVDLATLRGLVPPLASLPTALYFHENQFAYPQGAGAHGALEAQMVSLYSALAADRLLFNSRWNRNSFLAGVEDLLRRLPDAVPAGIVEQLTARAEVLPVPVTAGVGSSPVEAGRLQLVWNHRWEFDKGPALLLELVEALVGIDCLLHVVGQQFRRQPPEFDRLHELLEERGMLGHWGYIEDRGDYLALLRSSDVVLSTADHDFQGLSVLEAAALGCTPLAPKRLAYPEWFPDHFLYCDGREAATRIAGYAADKAAGTPLPCADVSELTPAALLPRYRTVLAALAASPVS